MSFYLLFFNPLLDLFYLRDLPCCLHLSIDHQGRGNHHAVIGDGLDVLDLDYLGLDAQFLDRLFCSILELITLRSVHPQNLDLLHQSSPPFLIILYGYPAIGHSGNGRQDDDNATISYGLFYAHDRP